MTQPTSEPKGFLASIGNAIAVYVVPALAPIIEKKLDEFKTDALALLADKLPDMAALVAESAVKAVFEHTEIDEAADNAIAQVTGFFEQFRKGLPFGLGG